MIMLILSSPTVYLTKFEAFKYKILSKAIAHENVPLFEVPSTPNNIKSQATSSESSSDIDVEKDTEIKTNAPV